MIRSLLITATLFLAASQNVWAQPATDATTNPPNIGRGPQTPEQKAEAERQMQEIMHKAQEQGMAMLKMSPEERKEAMHKLTEQILRRNLTRSGFADEKLQDRIIAFVAEQEKSRQKVRETASKVYLSLEKQEVPTDAKRMSLLLINYLNAVEAAKEGREAATKALDKAIDFTGKPHLMALLTLNGIIGDAAYFTGDVILTGVQSIGSLDEFVNAAPVAH